MNRTIKDATVKRFHDDNRDQLQQHFADFVAAHNFACRLKTLCCPTRYEAICKAWTDEPSSLIHDPNQQTPRPNNLNLQYGVADGSPYQIEGVSDSNAAHRLIPAS